MKQILLSLSLLFSVNSFGAAGLSGSYLRLDSTTLPSICRQGDVRVNSGTLSMCDNLNTWNAFGSVGGGGTGLSSATAHGVLLGEGTSAFGFTAAGTTGYFLIGQGGSADPIFSQIDLGTSPGITGTLGQGNGGTGFSTYTLGDFVYASASNTLSRLAGNTSATKKFLSQTGNGSISAAPVWAQPAFTDITGTNAVTAGGTGVTSVTTAPAASTFAGWDGNSNLSANNFIEAYATTATAGATTTLTGASKFQQYFTGSSNQTVALPVATTLVNGQQFEVVNASSGVVTVQSSGGNTIQALAAGSAIIATCINTGGGTGTASWNWVYIPSTAGAAGGGGGGSLQWIEDVEAPLPLIENSIRVYAFTSGLGQKLYCLVKVPATYVAGSPIKVKTAFYSADSSGTALINAVTTLIRTGTDVMSTTTNQRTTTNSAVTLSGGTAGIPQALSLDISSTTGQINSVSISAGDFILVQLTRGSDSATSDVKVPVYGAEVTFN